MIKEIVERWEKNKERMEAWFRLQHPESYEVIVKKIIDLVINGSGEDYEDYDIEKMVVVDHGDYQGTQLFIIPQQTYQPSENNYLFTHNYYGSCSGCDTLESIRGYEDTPPSEEQIKDYMGLALNLIQRMKKWGDLQDE